MKPKLLDLFCGAGGCSVGYARAGFDVVGVDLYPQKNYPFDFIQAHATDYLAGIITSGEVEQYTMIHASPPCQVHSVTKSLSKRYHQDQLPGIRQLLQLSGRPYVIENVPGAPLKNPLTLCGTMFPGLRVIRHRLFECNPAVYFPPARCNHIGKASGNKRNKKQGTLANFEYITVCGNDYIAADGREAMGINWTTKKELSQAIPPAYTEWLGNQMLKSLNPNGVTK